MSEFETITKCLEKRRNSVNELMEDQPEFLQLADMALENARGLMRVVYTQQVEDNFLGPNFAPALAHTIFDYLEDSFFLTCNRRLDQAAALCRMAAEATRDLRRICEDPKLEAVFLSKRDRRDEYQKLFRFKESISLETGLRLLYKQCSEYGVHGHLLRIMHQKPHDYLGGGAAIETRIPDVIIYQQIQFWIHAYRLIAPLVWRALRSRFKKYDPDDKVVEQFFLSLDGALKSSGQVIAELLAEQNSDLK